MKEFHPFSSEVKASMFEVISSFIVATISLLTIFHQRESRMFLI